MFRVMIGSMFVLDALWWYLADRRLRGLRHARLWRTLVALLVFCMAAGLAMFIVWPEFMRRTNAFLPSLINVAVFTWHLVILPTGLLLAALVGLAQLGTWLISRYSRRRPPEEPYRPATPDDASDSADELPQPSLSRRRLLAAASVAIPPLLWGGGVTSALFQIGHYRIRRIRVPLASLPPELDGLTIAHVTDPHVGRFTDSAMLQGIARRVNELNPDLVLCTGDLIDYSLKDLDDAIAMTKAMTPRYGMALCVGNHDLFQGPEAFVARTRAAGLNMLVNQWHTLKVRGVPIEIAGLNWARGDEGLQVEMNRLMLNQTVADRTRHGGFPICLSHHPHGFDYAAEAGFALTLAGHTHGGQIMLTDHTGPADIVYRYISGLYRKNPAQALVVANGVGNWFPLRVNAPSEICHLTLTRA